MAAKDNFYTQSKKESTLSKEEADLLEDFNSLSDDEIMELDEQSLNLYSELQDKEESIQYELSSTALQRFMDKGAISEIAKQAGTAAFGALSGATLGLPESPYIPDIVEGGFFKGLKEARPGAYGVGEVAGMLGSPIGKLGTAGKFIRGANRYARPLLRAGKIGGLAAAEQGTRALVGGASGGQAFDEGLTAGMYGFGIGGAMEGIGGLGRKLNETIGFGVGPETKLAYKTSKDTRNLVASPEFRNKVSEDFFDNLNDMEKFIASKKDEVGRELEDKMNAAKNVTNYIDKKGKIVSVQDEFVKLINKTIDGINKERVSLIEELRKDAPKARQFLQKVRDNVVFKNPEDAAKYEERVRDGMETYASKWDSIVEDSFAQKRMKANSNKAFGRKGPKKIDDFDSKDLAKGESKIAVKAEAQEILDGYNDLIAQLESKYLNKDKISLKDLVDFKRDMYTVLDYDKIKFPNAGAEISLDSTKQFKFKPIENVLQNFTKEVKEAADRIDDMAGIGGKRGLYDINEEYSALSKLEQTFPKVSELKARPDAAAISNATLKSREFRKLFSDIYPDDAVKLLDKNDELLELENLYMRTQEDMGFVTANPKNISGRVQGYPMALRAASSIGKGVGNLQETFPTATKAAGFAAKGLDMATGWQPSAVAGMELGRTNPEGANRATEWLFGTGVPVMGRPEEQEQKPTGIMDDLSRTPQSVLPPVPQQPQAIPELLEGKRLPRSYPGVSRNKDIFLPALYKTDPNMGRSMENALTSGDVKGVENLVSSLAQLPDFENIFEPPMVSTSKGRATSAIVTTDNKARVPNPAEVATMASDIKFDETKSVMEQMEQVDELFRHGTINLE